MKRSGSEARSKLEKKIGTSRPGEVFLLEKFFPEARFFESEIERSIKRFSESARPPKLRVFVDSANRNDYAMKLISTPMNENEDITGWVKRLIDAEEYCLALTGIAAWSERIAEALQLNFIQPWTELFGELLAGYESYFFLGKYPITPFGIHQDQEDSVLFHLGPNPKLVWIWEERAYVSEFGYRESLVNSYEVEARSSSARHYVLQAGDLLFIPKGDYHVLSSPEYSITLGLIPYPSTPKSIISDALGRVLNSNDNDDISYFDSSAIEDPFEALYQEAVSSALSLSELKNGMLLNLQALRSNGLLRTRPVIEARRNDISSSTQFFRRHFYPITWGESGDGQRMFIRGSEIKAGSKQIMETFGHFVNCNEQFSLTEICQSMRHICSDKEVKSLLNAAVSLGGVEVHE